VAEIMNFHSLSPNKFHFHCYISCWWC